MNLMGLSGLFRLFGTIVSLFLLSSNDTRIFGMFIVLGMTVDLVCLSVKIFKKFRIVYCELNGGNYYQFQLTNQDKKWYTKMLDYFTVETSDKFNNGISEKQLLKGLVKGPLMYWLLYSYCVTFVISMCLITLFNGLVTILIIFGQLFFMISFFTFLVYIYLPGITMITLPLVGVLSGEILREVCPNLFELNAYEASFYMALCMLLVTTLLSWIISEISPMYLLKNVSGVSGVLQLLFVSLIGTFIVKYGLPVLFYHAQPKMMPSYIAGQLDLVGKQLDFKGNSEVKALFFQMLKDFYTTSIVKSSATLRIYS